MCQLTALAFGLGIFIALLFLNCVVLHGMAFGILTY